MYDSSTTEKAACETQHVSLWRRKLYIVVESTHSMQMPGAMREKENSGQEGGLDLETI